MASVKKVTTGSGSYAPYDIYANVVTIHGNLSVVGNSSTIQSSNTAIYDNTIMLNAGETGSGVTLGEAGIGVDRGLLANVFIKWDETSDKWTVTNDGSTYFDILTSAGSVTAGGNTTDVQFNQGGVISGSDDFTFGTGKVTVFNTVIGNGNVTTRSSSNSDLRLTADGSGKVFIDNVLKMSFQGSAPSNVASTTQAFANTPGTAGSGLYVVNSSVGDELITKMRALAFNLLMS